MDFWTPEMRTAFINEAVNSITSTGERGVYRYRVFEDMQSAIGATEDVRRTTVTRVLAEVIHDKAKKLALGAYAHIVQKLCNNPVIGNRIFRDVVVLLKGSNAHLYFNNRTPNDIFNVSDTDIVVCIANTLSPDTFNMVKYQVEISIRQALSQYKRAVDNLLFLGGNATDTNQLLTPAEVAAFKEELTRRLADVRATDNDGTPLVGEFISPFASTEARNKCSRYSFMIKNSIACEGKKVMIHVPHFDKCECIPAKKTPMFISINDTLDFDRNKEGSKGKFTLHRMKMNVLHKWYDEENGQFREEKIPADFVDVSVPDRDDEELKHFWEHGMCVSVHEPSMNMWLTIPDLPTCIAELRRILDTYDNCEQKRMKRMRKLDALCDLQMLCHQQ